MKSEGFAPDNLSDEEKAKLAIEAQAAAEAAKQGIHTRVPDISKEDIMVDSENFDISVAESGKVFRKLKKEPTLDQKEIDKESKKRLALEAKKIEKEKIEATKISLKKETERMQEEAELLRGGAEYVIDEKGNKRLELTKEQTEKIAADKKVEDQEKIAKLRAERYGFKDTALSNKLFRGAGDTIGSIFGTRVIWEAKELYDNVKSKKGAKVAASELLETITLKNAQVEEGEEKPLTQSQLEKNRVIEESELIKGGAKYSFNENGERVLNMTKKQIENAKNEMNSENIEKSRVKGILEKKLVKSSLNPGENIEVGPVRDRIRSFNKKLQAVDMPATEKQELRNQMAELLREHRHDSNKLEAQKVEKVSRVFDVYANNSAKIMTVAKEAINTVSIFAMMPWLRGIGYTAFSGAESFMKSGNEYDKKHFKDGEVNTKEKLSYIGKALTIDSAKETYNSLIGNFYKKNAKGEKMGFGKALLGAGLKTLSIGGAALRLLGIGRFEQQLAAGNPIFREGGEKFVAAVASGQIAEALRQGGENWVHNVQDIVSVFSSSNADKLSPDVVKDGGVSYMAKGDAGVDKFIETEEIKQLATVGKGEGVIHAFTRQMEHDPKTFGFTGDLDDKVALHKWAQIHAYKAAIDNNFVDPTGQTEIRIINTTTPQQFILHPDLTVSAPNAENLYTFDQQAESVRVLADSEALSSNAGSLISKDGRIPEFLRAQEVNHKIHDIYSHWYSSDKQGMEEWQIMQDRPAQDIVDGKFGDPIHTNYVKPTDVIGTKPSIDQVEISNRNSLQGYLKELHDKSGLEINSGETTHDYIMRANDVHSLSMADYIKDQQVAEYVRVNETSSELKNIYSHWFSPDKQGLEEWKVMQDKPVKDIINGKFGDPIHTNYVKPTDVIGTKPSIDQVEISNRNGLQNYLKSLASKEGVVIKDNEKVKDFIMRVKNVSSLKF